MFELDSGDRSVIVTKSHFAREVPSNKVCDEVQTHIKVFLISHGLRIARPIVSVLEQDLPVGFLDTNRNGGSLSPSPTMLYRIGRKFVDHQG